MTLTYKRRVGGGYSMCETGAATPRQEKLAMLAECSYFAKEECRASPNVGRSQQQIVQYDDANRLITIKLWRFG